MNNKFLSIFLKIVRLILPCGAVALGLLNNAYRLTVVGLDDMVRWEYTNYFDTRIVESSDFGPMACMLLCIASIICAVYCFFKETERSLTTLATFCSFAMIGALFTLLIQNLTVIGWIIAALLAIDLAITAIQEMKLEDANRKL